MFNASKRLEKGEKKIKMLWRCSWFYFLMNRNKKKYSINNTTGKNSRRSSQNTYSSPTGSRTTERPPEDWQSVWSNDPTGSGSHKGRRRGEKQKERKKERAGVPKSKEKCKDSREECFAREEGRQRLTVLRTFYNCFIQTLLFTPSCK